MLLQQRIQGGSAALLLVRAAGAASRKSLRDPVYMGVKGEGARVRVRVRARLRARVGEGERERGGESRPFSKLLRCSAEGLNALLGTDAGVLYNGQREGERERE